MDIEKIICLIKFFFKKLGYRTHLEQLKVNYF